MKYIVGLWYDVDLENPVDNDSNWRLIDFRNGAPDETLTAEIKQRVERGDAFMACYVVSPKAGHDHSTVVNDADNLWTLSTHSAHWSPSDAGVLFWTGAIEELAPSRTEREASARVILREYTDWCNGSGYTYKVEAVSTCPTCGEHPKEVVAHEANYYDVAVDQMCDEIRHAIAVHAALFPLEEIEIEVEGNAMWLGEFHNFVPQPA